LALFLAAALSFSAKRVASVGAFFDAVLRLLSQMLSPLTSSTSWFETTERGATSVTSISSFAYASRCLSRSHSLPFEPDLP